MTDENAKIPGYKVTFITVDPSVYEEVKKFCLQMSGELKPNEPRYELRPTASWIGDGYEGIPRVCSNCGAALPIKDIRGNIIPKSVRYCYYCGAKLEDWKNNE